MMTAPEGSPERIEARQWLYRVTDHAIHRLGYSADEWLETVATTMPSQLAAVGEKDMRAIIAVVLGRGRRR